MELNISLIHPCHSNWELIYVISYKRNLQVISLNKGGVKPTGSCIRKKFGVLFPITAAKN